jgi:hypothetical protein
LRREAKKREARTSRSLSSQSMKPV